MKIGQFVIFELLGILGSWHGPWPLPAVAKDTPVNPGVPPTGPALEALRHQVELGFEAPLAKELDKIHTMNVGGDYPGCQKMLDHCIELYPGVEFLHLAKAQLYAEVKAFHRAQSEMEGCIKRLEAKGERYLDFYICLADIYVQVGARDKEAALLEKIRQFFPHSATFILKRQAAAYRRLGELDKMEKALAECQKLEKSEKRSPAAVPLLAVKPTGTFRRPPGFAYQIIARSHVFPRFKYTTDGTCGLGDTGTQQYVQMPPDYEQLIIGSLENRTCCKSKIEAVFRKLQKKVPVRPYSSCIRIGTVNIGPITCEQYFCRIVDENTYDLISVAQEIAVVPALARVEERLCDSVSCDCVVLGMSRVQAGYVRPWLQTYSLKLVKFDPKICQTIANYPQVRNIGALMFSDQGEFQYDDILPPEGAK